jgi:hypothetical protein
MNHAHVKDEKSLGSLFSDLTQEMQRLFRDELALFKNEMSRKISRGLKDISFLAIGALVLYAGLLAIIAAAVFLLGNAIPLWISALIVGAVVLGIGYYLVKKGMTDLNQTDFAPRETISTLKGDKEWLKKRT